MISVNKSGIVIASIALSFLLSACQSPASNTSTPNPQPEPVTAVPTPDDLIKGVLQYGKGQIGSLAGEDEFWAFDGKEGDIIDISMVSTSADMDPTFSLISPSNELLSTVYSEYNESDNYESNLKCFELPETGRYVVVASTYYADMMAGSYILTVDTTSDEDTNEPTPIVLGEVAENTGCGNQTETWSYSGDAGELIWVNITPNAAVDLNAEIGADLDLQIESPSGTDEGVTELARYRADTELNVIYILGERGDYTIRVKSPEGEETPPLMIRLNPAPEGGYYYGGLSENMQVLAISYPGIGIVPFDAGSSGPDLVSITALTPNYPQCDELPVSLNLISPEGLIVAGTSESETVTLDSLPIPIDGTILFPMGETETYQKFTLEQLTLDVVGRYLIALVSLRDEPMYPDDCSYFALSTERLGQ